MEFWSKLPEIFQKDVVKKLDFKSRCRFRKVAKYERALVDSCPVFLDWVNLEPRVGNQVYFSIEDSGALLNDKAYCTEDVLQDFLCIFKNPKSKLKQLTMDHYNFQRQPDAINDLFALLISRMNSSGILQLKIQQLSFHYGEISETTFLNIINIMDSKFLNSLHVRKFPIKTRTTLNELVETEQWKSLEDIRIQEKISNSFELFLHCNMFRVTFHSLSSLNVWKIIQNFRKNPRPNFSFFEIYLMQEISIQDVFSHFDVPLKNQPIEHYISNLAQHTQHFKLEWSLELVLVVRMHKRYVKGAICRKEFLFEDFEEHEDL